MLAFAPWPYALKKLKRVQRLVFMGLILFVFPQSSQHDGNLHDIRDHTVIKLKSYYQQVNFKEDAQLLKTSMQPYEFDPHCLTVATPSSTNCCHNDILFYMYSAIINENMAKGGECTIVQPVSLQVSVARNLSSAWYHGQPDIELSARLQSLSVIYHQ